MEYYNILNYSGLLLFGCIIYDMYLKVKSVTYNKQKLRKKYLIIPIVVVLFLKIVNLVSNYKIEYTDLILSLFVGMYSILWLIEMIMFKKD